MFTDWLVSCCCCYVNLSLVVCFVHLLDAGLSRQLQYAVWCLDKHSDEYSYKKQTRLVNTFVMVSVSNNSSSNNNNSNNNNNGTTVSAQALPASRRHTSQLCPSYQLDVLRFCLPTGVGPSLVCAGLSCGTFCQIHSKTLRFH